MIDYSSVLLDASDNKEQIIDQLIEQAKNAGYSIIDVDASRPWGGFIRFGTKDSTAFVEQFFSDIELEVTDANGAALPLSPKFLLVSPHQRLSWQRHQRRSEVWRFLTDGGAYSKSPNPGQQPVFTAKADDLTEIEQGYCHRLISQSNDYVLVAEVWRHSDADNLSTEDDNERLEDDYNR